MKVSIEDLHAAREVLLKQSEEESEPLGRVADWLLEVIERMKHHPR